MNVLIEMYIRVLEGYGNMECIKVYVNEKLPVLAPSVACIGYFDGLHIGHQKLIDDVLKHANELDIIPACICFDNDPWVVMHKSEDTSQLTPLSKRLSLLEERGIKRCFLLHFDEEMCKLSSASFIKMLEDMHIKTLICGNDFRFAHKGEGNVETLKTGNFEVLIHDHILYHGHKISSSVIENNIKTGNIEDANKQLGYPYCIEGSVIHGNKVGNSKLGFPTANIKLNEEYVLPKQGVYAGLVKIRNQFYLSMINIGYNPTMNLLDKISIEAHILDFEEQIYDEEISVYFYAYLRDEMKFETTEALIEQLHKDLDMVRLKKGWLY